MNPPYKNKETFLTLGMKYVSNWTQLDTITVPLKMSLAYVAIVGVYKVLNYGVDSCWESFSSWY